MARRSSLFSKLRHCFMVSAGIAMLICLGNLFLFSYVPQYRSNLAKKHRRFDNSENVVSNSTSDTILQPEARYGFDSINLAPQLSSERPFLVILISSSPQGLKHRLLRQAIRETWGRVCRMNSPINSRQADTVRPTEAFDCALAFFVGQSIDRKSNEDIIQEGEENGDMLVSDGFDGYYNITDKLLVAFKWASLHQPRFVLKTDDDVYVNVKRLLLMLQSDHQLPRDLYGGSLYHGSVTRERSSKHYVTMEEYPEKRYPPYCKGSQYVFSGHLLDPLLEVAAVTPHFKIDDAYVGILMKHIHVNPINLQHFVQFTWMPYFIDYLSPCSYSSLISMGDNLSEKQLRQIHIYMGMYQDSKNYCVLLPVRILNRLVAFLIIIALATIALVVKSNITKPALFNDEKLIV